jgi:hypothetical protein
MTAPAGAGWAVLLAPGILSPLKITVRRSLRSLRSRRWRDGASATLEQ